MYKISTHSQTEPAAGRSYDCAIYGDILVSYGYGSNWHHVSIHNLSTNEENWISSNVLSDRFYPDIYGDRVMWLDSAIVMKGIYMYDMSTANETRIFTNGSARLYPAIYRDRVVWEDTRTNKSAIYIYDLSAEPIKPQAFNSPQT